MINIDQFQPKPLSSDRKPSSACFKTWPKKSLFVFAAWIDFGSVLRQATTLRRPWPRLNTENFLEAKIPVAFCKNKKLIPKD